ncbi:hypothetical protein TH0225_09850 [Helicobacter pylori]
MNFYWFDEISAVIHNTPKVFERKSLFDNKFSEITAFVVFTNESDTIFNLKNYLLVLAKNLNSRDIWYCENAICDKNGAYNIELVSNDDDFGEVLDIVKGAFDDDLLQLLINKQNEFYFHKRIINNGLPFGIIFIASNSDNPIDIDDKTKKLESCFCDDKKGYCLNFQRIYPKSPMNYHNFLQTLKIQKAPMKKFHFRNKKISTNSFIYII